MPTEGETVARLISGEVELCFTWEGDRYQHTFRCAGAELQSVDGKPFDPPVYTDLHVQDGVIFGSGMSGGRHWSVSVEPAEAGFLFDVACRVKLASPKAGAWYRGVGWRIACPDEPATAQVESSANGEFWVVAPVIEPEETPHTIRYRYCVTAAL